MLATVLVRLHVQVETEHREIRRREGGKTVELIPQVEMFNTFNNDNFVNALWTPGNNAPSTNAPSLFNFDGFLRQGFGDPRQMQLSVRLTF